MEGKERMDRDECGRYARTCWFLATQTIFYSSSCLSAIHGMHDLHLLASREFCQFCDQEFEEREGYDISSPSSLLWAMLLAGGTLLLLVSVKPLPPFVVPTLSASSLSSVLGW